MKEGEETAGKERSGRLEKLFKRDPKRENQQKTGKKKIRWLTECRRENSVRGIKTEAKA